MTKKPEDFKITGEKGINIIEEDFFGPETAIPSESRLVQVALESNDYGHEKRLSLTFERHNSKGVLPVYRDTISFQRMEEVRTIITKLKEMTGRLETFCIDHLDPGKRHG